MTPEEIVRRVTAYDCRHVVLTGGEPMVASGIRELAALLKAKGLHITIETAATILPEGIPCDLASLSPKLADSTPSEEQAGAWSARHEESRYRPDVIRQWLENYACQVKFVFSQPEQLSEIEELLNEVGSVQGFTRDRVLLMPEGTDSEALREKAPVLAELCIEHEFRYAPRLHIDLFGNTKGT
jgi:7-carboxy-7-deazaguanine synthase